MLEQILKYEKAYLHAEQQHFEPFQDYKALKLRKQLFSVMKWSGRQFHRLADANLKLSYPTV